MKKKRIVIALGHDALGTTLPEQQAAIKRTAKAINGIDFKRVSFKRYPIKYPIIAIPAWKIPKDKAINKAFL